VPNWDLAGRTWIRGNQEEWHENANSAAGSPDVITRGGCSVSSMVSLSIIAFSAFMLVGCSVSIPMSPLIDRETITGSLPVKTIDSLPLAPGLDNDDKRLSASALAAALDPSANGRTIDWANPRTNIKGSFKAAGKAPAPKGRKCMRFDADITQVQVTRTLTGRACNTDGKDWTIVEIEKRESGAS